MTGNTAPAVSNPPPGWAAGWAAQWAHVRRRSPWLRIHLLLIALVTLALPVLLQPLAPAPPPVGVGLTVVMLLAVSVFHVEVARRLVGGRSPDQQPHKALSAWAFAAALLLPPLAIPLVVTVTYAHARWRGLRVQQLWTWLVSGCYVVVAGCAAAAVMHAVTGPAPLVGNGGTTSSTEAGALLLAAAAFLVVQFGLFASSAFLHVGEQEDWLRGQLTSGGFYLTETGVIAVGGLVAVLWSLSPWLTLMALPVHVLAARAALLQPVRERAAAASALRRQNEVLAESNRFKVDLLGMLGHEVGNPLTTVIGWSQVAHEAVEEGDLETAASSLEAVRRGTRRTREVLADITAMVATDTGNLAARPESVELGPFLGEVVDNLETRPRLSCPPGLVVLAQPGHLHQVLGNLLSNAEKYADGATEVRAEPLDAGRVRISVVDGGRVPEGVRDRLFDRFSRASEHGAVRGTGLGLFITRELARANGGDVVYRPRDDAPGSSGSVFEVTLPSAPAGPPACSGTAPLTARVPDVAGSSG